MGGRDFTIDYFFMECHLRVIQLERGRWKNLEDIDAKFLAFLAPRAKVLGSLGRKYIAQIDLVQCKSRFSVLRSSVRDRQMSSEVVSEVTSEVVKGRQRSSARRADGGRSANSPTAAIKQCNDFWRIC